MMMKIILCTKLTKWDQGVSFGGPRKKRGADRDVYSPSSSKVADGGLEEFSTNNYKKI